MAGDRTEKATPKKRSEARGKGQLARSAEVNSAAVLTATVVALSVTAPNIASSLTTLVHETMTRAQQPQINGNTIGALLVHWGAVVGGMVTPVVAAAAAGGLIANVIQNKPGLHLKLLRPDFRKVSPASGIKRLLGPQGGIEIAKSLLKVAIVGGVAAVVLVPKIGALTSLNSATPATIGSYAAGTIQTLSFFVIGILVPFALVDFMLARRRHEKSLRMSKQEVKEEARQQDVSPEIKSAIRRKQFQMSRQRMLAHVPSADVIVTNPTHFAVALRYGKDVAAPRVVAKGADLLAKRIREIAAEHDVAIVENPPLARALYDQVDIDQEIPPTFFAAVAEVLAFVFRTSRRKLSWA
jgi:flagellar biosynthesis protein FlhB